ncbi:FAD binding domain protein [Hyaloscypha variabilis F]|uniref:FAD binding domain protein n=1 Tax=Hyaloscypha variabilis (strain UAMH 11265 / GT02V1 / F) TaxID=1149755 RepID=A0A2J6QWL2_HYAVF|nr:FAD binding domain protein [Hyaloscypha variabilis F]
MPKINKVLIIGAGPAGVSAALHLQQSNNISPVLYEIRPEPTTLGGAIGIPSNGSRLLDRLGLYEELLTRASSGSDLVIHSVKGHVLGKMDQVGWSKEKTGFGYLRIKRVDLMDVLLKAAQNAGIPIHYGKRLVGIKETDGGVTATFSDGSSDTADLLLGCDGIHSAVRKTYVDPETTPEYSGISNVFSIVPTSQLPPAAMSLDGLNATLVTDGLFAITPCTRSGDSIYWFFSREVTMPSSGYTRDGWEEHGNKEVGEFKATMDGFLKDLKGEWGDLLRRVVYQTEVVKFYPIFRLPLGGRWSRGRCLLIGDAAHAMQPHASQGVSMALEDIFLLSRLLQKSDYSLDDVFGVYDQRRRPRVNEMHKTAERNGTVRKSTSGWRLAVNETVVSGALWVYGACNLNKLGLGQKPLAYDVEEENLDL